jgi:hypothetical protein
MAGIAAGGEVESGPRAKNLGRRRAAGIYGAIITAAIRAAVGGHLRTGALVVAVVVTLMVYWLAEEYAELLGEQIAGGRLPNRAYIREALRATWPMVSASYLPLLALLLARVAGADRGGAAADGARLVGGPGRQAARPATAAGHVGGRGAGPGHDRAQGPGPHPPALTSGRRAG